ncbi:MAG: hypothetical protein ACOYI2_10980, partial [Bacillota bacterium]
YYQILFTLSTAFFLTVSTTRFRVPEYLNKPSLLCQPPFFWQFHPPVFRAPEYLNKPSLLCQPPFFWQF